MRAKGMSWIALLTFAVGCSAGEPVTPPTEIQSQDDDPLLHETDPDVEDEDEDEDQDSGSDFDTGGASVGSEEVQAAVEKCHDKGRFFDRFAHDGEGECTKLKLAKVDCTIKGVRKHMTPKEESDFEAILDGAFKDFQIDQCLDCPPGETNKLCETKQGNTPGTKIFFVVEEGSEIRGNAVKIKARPSSSSGDDD